MADLAPLLPALLDALGTVGVGVIVLVDRGAGLERYFASPAAAALLGYTPDELAALPALIGVVPEQRAQVAQLAASLRDGASAQLALEVTAVRKDGSRVPIELAVASVRLPDSTTFVAVTRQILALHRAHLSLLEADRISLVGTLAAGFAHEINNPLTSMLLQLRALRRQLAGSGGPGGGATQPLTRALDDLTTGAERIAGNVRALGALANRGVTTALDLAAVVSSALRLAAPALEPRAHVIRQIFPVEPITGEEARLGQAVLAMLLFSSSGFEPEPSEASNRIVVSLEQRGRELVLEVSDNGRALTDEEAAHAFDPFFHSSARASGVGVGLGVARSVAIALGGTVALAPRSGGGAVITMTLPSGGPPPPASA